MRFSDFYYFWHLLHTNISGLTYLIAWTKLVHSAYLSLIKSFTKHIDRRHLSTKHCVHLHITSSTNVTFVERLHLNKNIFVLLRF